jgi:adenine specific DNA methylase Mod
MKLTIKQMEEFLELEGKVTPGEWELKEYKGMFRIYSGEKSLRIVSGIIDSYSSEDERINGKFIAQSRSIASQAVRELMEARELLKKVLYSGKNCRANSGAIYVHDPTIKEIEEFLAE